MVLASSPQAKAEAGVPVASSIDGLAGASDWNQGGDAIARECDPVRPLKPTTPISGDHVTPPAPRFYRPELDALRLVAFLMVWFSHSLPTPAQGARGIAPASLWWLKAVKEAGNFGVCVFFFLSAYLITELLRRERLATGTVHLRAFYLRRILRIWPLYLGVLAAYALLGLHFHGFRIEPGRLLASLLLAGNWYIAFHPAILTPMRALWSLSVEEQFYLGWPVLARFASPAVIAAVCLILIGSGQATLVWLAHHAAQPSMLHVTAWVNSLVQFQFFALGTLAALLLAGRQPRLSLFARAAMLAAAIVAMLIASGICGIKRPDLPHTAGSLATGYALAALGSALLFGAVLGLPNRFIPSWAIRLGQVSFGLYVFHETGFFLADTIEKHLPLPAGWNAHWALALAANKALSLVFTIALAFASYHFWERPFLRLKDRFTFIPREARIKPKSQTETNHALATPPRILIYRSELLAYSETFIAAQAAALRSSAPIFVGLRRVHHSLNLPGPSFVVSQGDSLAQRALRYAFLQTGRAPRLIADLRAQNPALLHAHFAIDAAEALPLARALAIPLIVTLHGYDVMANDQAHSPSRRGRVYLARRQRLFRQASLFLCVSEAIRQKAITRGFPPHKLRVHPIGIDVARFQPADNLSSAPDILFVGRLVEKKGCAHLIHAMCEVRRVLPQARMIVLGDGPERSRLEAEAHRWGSQAIFLGVQSGEQVRQWMASTRVLAVPSITARDGDAEGLPTVLYEALAMGLPVACFRTSGIPELVRDGVEGLLADEGDEAGLALNLLRLCQDDALAQHISKAGRRRVEQSFELGAQTAQLEAIYAELAGSSYHLAHASGDTRVNGVLREAPSKSTAGEHHQPSASPQISPDRPPHVLVPNSWKHHEHASHISS